MFVCFGNIRLDDYTARASEIVPLMFFLVSERLRDMGMFKSVGLVGSEPILYCILI